MNHEAREKAVLEKCNYFATYGIWPGKTLIDPETWLDNFDVSERHTAVELLDAYVMYSQIPFQALLDYSFSELHRIVVDNGLNWGDFVSSMIVTYPTGETPNPSDSGHMWLNYVKSLGISESQLMEPEDAIAARLSSESLGLPRPVLLVDDFVGSGSQIITTWERLYDSAGTEISFESTTLNVDDCYYCCAFCTSQGQDLLKKLGIPLRIIAAHVLTDDDGVLCGNTRLVESKYITEVQNLIRTVSLAAGFDDTDGQSETDWQGFAKLGLFLSFNRKTPDACLPLLYMPMPNWVPLVKT